MPKISLWKPNKGNDYRYADRMSAENLHIGGVGVLVHKYAGVDGNGDTNEIQDFLFLENRDRDYEDTVYELRGHFTPEDVDYDLSQFGIFLSSDTLRFTFHYNDMVELLGRKMISGDVIELTNSRDTTSEGVSVNEYYVVQDALYSAPGHSHTWYPHLWKVRAKQMPASAEYQDILDKQAKNDTIGGEGDGTGLMPFGWADVIQPDGSLGFGPDPKVVDAFTRYCSILNVTDGVVAEAAKNAFYDPKFLETPHLWITLDPDTGYPMADYWASGDGVPPNGAPLKGIGEKFPDDMADGEYFLRIDYVPDRLFQKQGSCFKRIEDDLRTVWTGYNKRLDTFIDNINTTALDDGTVVKQRQSLSKVLEPIVDLNEAHKEETIEKQTTKARRAKKLDSSK